MGEVKFSCPQCQQRLSCDEMYGGQQIQCPACATLVEVPPPLNPPAAKLSINRPQTAVSPTAKPIPEQRRPVPPRRSLLPKIALSMLPVIGLGVIIILAVRGFKSSTTSSSAVPTAESNSNSPALAADHHETSKTEVSPELQKVEQAVISQVRAVQAATQRRNTATQNRDLLHQTYKGKNLPQAQYSAVMQRYKAADDEIANSEAALTVAKNNFEAAFLRYQQLGGKTDYRSQIQ